VNKVYHRASIVVEVTFKEAKDAFVGIPDDGEAMEEGEDGGALGLVVGFEG